MPRSPSEVLRRVREGGRRGGKASNSHPGGQRVKELIRQAREAENKKKEDENKEE